MWRYNAAPKQCIQPGSISVKRQYSVGQTFFIGLLALVAVSVAALSTVFHSVLTRGQGFTKSVDVDRSRYYRLKVELLYKGEQQNFDIVVGCNVLQINYRDSSRTVEVGLVPSVFGRRMNDGKGLVVRPPRACRGETTANGQVPSDLLPVVVVYDDAETLAFGTAYLSEDAYQSPMSLLRFGGATIEPATKAEFEEFRSAQPNLVQPASYHTPSGLPPLKERGLSPATVPMGTGCYAYARFRLIGDQLRHAREIWPADRPRYWRPTNREGRGALMPVSPHPPMAQTDHDGAPVRQYRELTWGLNHEVVNSGLPTHGGGGVIGNRHGNAFSLSYYPDIGGWVGLPWPSDPAARAATLLRDGPHVGASVDFRDGQTRGFAYCRPSVGNFPTGRTLADYPDPTMVPWYSYVRMPAIDRVDGIDLQPPSAQARGGFDGPGFFVERDEFIFRRVTIGLSSIRGDI
jgi:hypothetical protein